MTSYSARASAVISAAPEIVMDVLKDYHGGHAAVLPRKFFRKMEVESGGSGAGTVILVHMDVYGNSMEYRMVVSEPEPGRVLCEEDAAAGVRTCFSVEPLEEGHRSRVTILTESRQSRGLRGLMERWFTPGIMRKIYREELALLQAYIQEINKPAAQAGYNFSKPVAQGDDDVSN